MWCRQFVQMTDIWFSKGCTSKISCIYYLHWISKPADTRSLNLLTKPQVLQLTLAHPSSESRRSATNSMYWHMSRQFIPMSATGKASVRYSFSISTASRMISWTRSSEGLWTTWENRRQAKSVCRPWKRYQMELELYVYIHVILGLQIGIQIHHIHKICPQNHIICKPLN